MFKWTKIETDNSGVEISFITVPEISSHIVSIKTLISMGFSNKETPPIFTVVPYSFEPKDIDIHPVDIEALIEAAKLHVEGVKKKG